MHSLLGKCVTLVHNAKSSMSALFGEAPGILAQDAVMSRLFNTEELPEIRKEHFWALTFLSTLQKQPKLFPGRSTGISFQGSEDDDISCHLWPELERSSWTMVMTDCSWEV